MTNDERLESVSRLRDDEVSDRLDKALDTIVADLDTLIESGLREHTAEPAPRLTWRFVEYDRDESYPCGDDYIISSPASGPYMVFLCGKRVGEYSDEHAVCAAIWDHMEACKFWPNVWHVNERGTVDLCEIEEEGS